MSHTGSLVEGEFELVATGFEFTEGPVWLPGDGLIFSDIRGDTIYHADQRVFRRPSGKANGLAIDARGRLIACEHWNRRVSITEADGTIAPLAEFFEGKRLNSPNDVVVRGDGAVFFTDPPYGLEGRPPELDFRGVYCVSPRGVLTLLLDDLEKPNGLAFSADEQTLYIADTERHQLRAYRVGADGKVESSGLFCELPRPDGLKLDAAGNVWCAAEDGVRVFAADGRHVQTVVLPKRPSNCAFGDSDGRTLYVTAREDVYRLDCRYPGLNRAHG